MSVKKIVGAIALTAVVAGAIILPATTASATVTGVVGIQCTASLPAFPTASGGGTCSGLSAGAGAGVDDQGAPYAIAGPGAFNASFAYNEACVLNEPPLLGAANGQASVTGLTSNQGSARLDTNFAWTRVGVVAVLITSGTRVSFLDNGHTATAVTPDVGVAAFAPLLGPTNVCPNGGPLSAVVVGADVQPL